MKRSSSPATRLSTVPPFASSGSAPAVAQAVASRLVPPPPATGSRPPAARVTARPPPAPPGRGGGPPPGAPARPPRGPGKPPPPPPAPKGGGPPPPPATRQRELDRLRTALGRRRSGPCLALGTHLLDLRCRPMDGVLDGELERRRRR